MLLPALIYTLVNCKVGDLVALYKNLRSVRPSAAAKYYNQSQLEHALGRMDLQTLRDAWTQVSEWTVSYTHLTLPTIYSV